jgi:DNA invertase Pin-like site-specific DNA recombinase
MKTAYSYARFSSKKQEKGDSLRRQIERADKWCREHRYRLDDSLKPDKGVSAFRGRNSKKGTLAGFLLEMDAGTIRPGSALIVESPDRLSREPLDEATNLFKRILRAGITIITLTPFYEFAPEDRNDLGKMIVLQAMVSRAHEESKLKSERVAASKERIRQTGFTKLGLRIKKCPEWLRLSDDGKRYIVIPEKVKIVRLVFRLAGEGYGIQRLAKKLSHEGIAPLCKTWSRSGILLLLRSRTVLGEFQQHVGYGNKSDRKPVGDPIKGYYPAVIDEELFYRVQAEFSKRSFGRPAKDSKNPGQRFNGRIGGNVASLFSGLCIDARNGSRFNITYGGNSGDDFPKRFVSYGSLMQRKGTEYASIPYDVFERVFLTWTKELKAKDVLPSKGNESLEESVEANEAKLAEINQKIEKVKAKMVGTGDVDVLYDVLFRLDKERQSLTVTVERLKAQLHSSETVSLEETQELMVSWPRPRDRSSTNCGNGSRTEFNGLSPRSGLSFTRSE